MKAGVILDWKAMGGLDGQKHIYCEAHKNSIKWKKTMKQKAIL
jgi:hypothetical protein